MGEGSFRLERWVSILYGTDVVVFSGFLGVFGMVPGFVMGSLVVCGFLYMVLHRVSFLMLIVISNKCGCGCKNILELTYLFSSLFTSCEPKYSRDSLATHLMENSVTVCVQSKVGSLFITMN